jgi:serine protease Do
MKNASKLKRHVMALALGISFVSMVSWQGIAGSLPVQAPATLSKDYAGTKPADVKGEVSSKFDISKGFSSIAEKAIMAVVNVSTTQVVEGGRPGKDGFPQFPPGSPLEDFFKEFFDQMERPRKVQSLGSGFIIQSDETSATIVTNYHVIADSKKITVFLNDNTELDATILAFDERTDIALLKVKTDTLPAAKRKLPTLEWGDSNAVKVGDWILAIGNPFGLGSTVTSGIISNRARDIMLRSGGRNRVNDYVDDFMQHDAAINMGNSGGPLLNLEGKVVGINTAIFSPSGGNIGIGFAIPAAVSQDTVNQLIKFGRTKRGWLGVRIQPVTPDIAESLGLGSARGAIVGSVTPDGPAAKAKIEPEDIILELDGKEVNEKSRLARLVGETPVNKTVKVKLLRKGKELTVDVILGEFEIAQERGAASAPADKKSAISQESVEVLGIKLSALTPEIRERYKLPKDAKGIMVLKVDINSTAVEIGLKGIERDKAGDIIEKVNQKELTKPEEFAKAVEDAKKENRKNILLLISRDGEPRFVPLKLENEDLKDSAKGGSEDPKLKVKDKEKDKKDMN